MAEPTFDRGFKTWCEKVAASTRAELKLTPSAPLPPTSLANHLAVDVWTPEDLGLAQGTMRILVRESDDWSAVTIVQGEKTAIIHNSEHKGGRIASDIMHELAHIVLEHQAGAVVVSTLTKLAIRSFDQKQEAEAAWLSGCMLLPRPALLEIERKRLPPAEACQIYAVSSDLLTYRRNITGVARQMGQRRARRRA